MTSDYSALLNLLWRLGSFTGRDMSALSGEKVRVESVGEYDESEGVWYGAEIVVDGERRCGEVVVGDRRSSDRAILRLVCDDVGPMLDFRDRLVPQVMCEIDESLKNNYLKLLEGSRARQCASRLAVLDDLHRTDLVSKLLVDRLQRKCGDIGKLYAECDKDWQQTFYIMLFRSLGGNRNRAEFRELAEKVDYSMVMREKRSCEGLEAM